jgi:alpha-tubulin suppressor-like RCC1 family protein
LNDILDNGRLYGWGNNEGFELVDGTLTDKSEPIAMATTGALSAKKVKLISSSVFTTHTLVLTSKSFQIY